MLYKFLILLKLFQYSSLFRRYDFFCFSLLCMNDDILSWTGSRLASPRPGSLRQSRKRALSASPYSDSFDINSMIRFSPNSLASIVNGSGRSSSASGSYGHLSAGAISPALGLHPGMAPHLQQLQAHLMRTATGSLLPHSPLPPPPQGLFGLPHSPLHPHVTSKQESDKLPADSAVSSSSVAAEADTSSSSQQRRTSSATRIKREPPSVPAVSTSSSQQPPSEIDLGADEPGDFIETNCHWRECGLEFPTQDDLVKVSVNRIF